MSYRLPFIGDWPRKNATFHRTAGNMSHCEDFEMPVGTSILAARGGLVITVVDCYNKSYNSVVGVSKANVIEIQHSDGEQTVYAHLKFGSIKVAVGERVRVGQKIAESGDTGYASYPHLHFGVYDENNRNVRISWQ